MERLTLEQEFAENCRMHKFAILKKMMYRYYRALEDNSGITVPEFMVDEICNERALTDVRQLYLTNPIKFDTMYEEAYKRLEAELR